jgi:hypothetical protein
MKKSLLILFFAFILLISPGSFAQECVIYENTCEDLGGAVSIGLENYPSFCSQGIFSGPVCVNGDLVYQNVPCDSGICADEFSCSEIRCIDGDGDGFNGEMSDGSEYDGEICGMLDCDDGDALIYPGSREGYDCFCSEEFSSTLGLLAEVICSACPLDQDGISCRLQNDPPDQKSGFCKAGACLARNCENLYGQDQESCGSGPGLNCCFKDGCYKNKICCKPEPLEEGQTYRRIIAYDYCKKTACLDPDQKLCEADEQNECCPQDAICIKHARLGFEGAECGKASCGDGETSCPEENPGDFWDGEGVLCCKDDFEVCVNHRGFEMCNAKEGTEKEGYTFCKGKGNNHWRSRWCKNGVETCSWQPEGYPFCVPINSNIEAQSDQQSNSIYMIREKNSFGLSGIVYVVDPNMTFNVPIQANLVVGANEQAYKYNFHDGILDLCTNKEILDSSTALIRVEGSSIELDELSLIIPSGALSESVIFNITKYNLSDCYNIGKKDSYADLFDFSVGFLDVIEAKNIFQSREIEKDEFASIVKSWILSS